MNVDIQSDTSKVICSLDDLVADSGVAALYEDQQLALFYLPGERDKQIHALGNFDPLGRANVLSRGIVGDIAGEPVVASPLYKHHFSLLTGRCIENSDVSVPVYEVEISGTQVILRSWCGV